MSRVVSVDVVAVSDVYDDGLSEHGRYGIEPRYELTAREGWRAECSYEMGRRIMRSVGPAPVRLELTIDDFERHLFVDEWRLGDVVDDRRGLPSGIVPGPDGELP